MADPQAETVRAKFEEWKASLPKCLGYEGSCDGDLEGMSHEDNCPMFGKEFATHFDAFSAGMKAAETRNEKIKELLPSTFYADRTIERRIEFMVESWQRAIKVNQSLEARNEALLQALKEIIEEARKPLLSDSLRLARVRALAYEFLDSGSASQEAKTPGNIIRFDETHIGYWTGDNECSCFNPVSPLNLATERQLRHDWYDACTYIRLSGLESGKKYKVTLHVEAEELTCKP